MLLTLAPVTAAMNIKRRQAVCASCWCRSDTNTSWSLPQELLRFTDIRGGPDITALNYIRGGPDITALNYIRGGPGITTAALPKDGSLCLQLIACGRAERSSRVLEAQC